MLRYSAVCACLLACWPRTALASPVHRRQGDPNSSSNAIIIALSAAAAVVLLASVIILIYFPSTRTLWKPAFSTFSTFSTYPLSPVTVKPEIQTTTTTTVTHSRHTSSQSSTDVMRGGPERLSNIGLAISDDGHRSSSVYSESEYDTDYSEKDRASHATRPPSSVLSRTSYSCYVTSDRSDDTASQSHQSYQAQRPPQVHKPISWLRLSTTTTTTTSPPPPLPTKPWPQAAGPRFPTDLASRRGQPTLRHIHVPS